MQCFIVANDTDKGLRKPLPMVFFVPLTDGMVSEVIRVHLDVREEEMGSGNSLACPHAFFHARLPSINKKCCVPHQYNINLVSPMESRGEAGRAGRWRDLQATLLMDPHAHTV